MASGPPELWLIRHGETEWTLSRRHTGATDIPLTEHGREQGRALARLLAGREFDLVLSSPRRRAHETAELAGFAPEPDEQLAEWDYGDYEGRTTAEIRGERPNWDLWRDGCPGGESPVQIEARLAPLREKLRERSGERFALFGHGHCLRALAATWLGLGLEAGRALALGPASLSILADDRGIAVVELWNRQVES
jgi:broad specificity phosphatase PhoE